MNLIRKINAGFASVEMSFHFYKSKSYVATICASERH